MPKETTERTIVFGATGYTGTALIKQLASRPDTDVFAHVRPNSKQRDQLQTTCNTDGTHCVVTDWTLEDIKTMLAEVNPTLVFATLGTTKKRQRASNDKDAETYKAIDYGLTVMVIRALVELQLSPLFVYLSSMGVSDKAPGAYLHARFEAENYLKHSELPYLIARPSFITGADREEFRAGERIGASIADVGLTVAGLVGFVGLRDRYQSLTASELAAAMIDAVDSGERDVTLDARNLRNRIR